MKASMRSMRANVVKIANFLLPKGKLDTPKKEVDIIASEAVSNAANVNTTYLSFDELLEEITEWIADKDDIKEIIYPSNTASTLVERKKCHDVVHANVKQSVSVADPPQSLSDEAGHIENSRKIISLWSSTSTHVLNSKCEPSNQEHHGITDNAISNAHETNHAHVDDADDNETCASSSTGSTFLSFVPPSNSSHSSVCKIMLDGIPVVNLRGIAGLYSWVYNNCIEDEGSKCYSSEAESWSSNEEDPHHLPISYVAGSEHNSFELRGWTGNIAFKSQMSNYFSRQVGRRVYFVQDLTLDETRALARYIMQQKTNMTLDWAKNKTPQMVLKPLLTCTNLNAEDIERLSELYMEREDLLLNRLVRLRDDQRSSWMKKRENALIHIRHQ